MQRGPLLQPSRSTERVLSGPPRAHPSGCCSAVPSSQGSARTGSRSRTATGFDGLDVFTCPAPPKKQTHPLGGFSSRRLLSKSLTPFPGGSPPASGPLPPSANTPHPFSPKLSRFVCWRHKPRQPRVSANLCCGERVTSPVRVPLSLPICAKGFGLFTRAQNAGSAGTPHGLRSKQQPALPQRAACGRHPLLRPRRSGSPAGHGFQGSEPRLTFPPFGCVIVVAGDQHGVRPNCPSFPS